jgi:flagellar motility protein MotE (MotC chaperone)
MENKEKFLQLLSEVLDKNVFFSLHVSQFQGESSEKKGVTKSEAQELISRFSEVLNISIQHKENQPYADHFQVDNTDFRVVCSYVPSEEEKKEAKLKKIDQLKQELSELEKEETA